MWIFDPSNQQRAFSHLSRARRYGGPEGNAARSGPSTTPLIVIPYTYVSLDWGFFFRRREIFFGSPSGPMAYSQAGPPGAVPKGGEFKTGPLTLPRLADPKMPARSESHVVRARPLAGSYTGILEPQEHCQMKGR